MYINFIRMILFHLFSLVCCHLNKKILGIWLMSTIGVSHSVSDERTFLIKQRAGQRGHHEIGSLPWCDSREMFLFPKLHGASFLAFRSHVFESFSVFYSFTNGENTSKSGWTIFTLNMRRTAEVHVCTCCWFFIMSLCCSSIGYNGKRCWTQLTTPFILILFFGGIVILVPQLASEVLNF